MFRLTVRDKRKIVDEKVKSIGRSYEDSTLTSMLDQNVEIIRKLFEDVDTLRIRTIENRGGGPKCCIIYSDGVVSSTDINDNIIKPLTLSALPVGDVDFIDAIMNQILQIGEMRKSDKIQDIIEAITYGDTVLLVDDSEQAVILNTKGFQTRSITEPENERSLNGPREGFTESMMLNLSMIRRRVLSAELKMKFRVLGRRTHTKTCICYMDGLVNKDILAELHKRLDKIDIDAVLDTNYITELIRDSRFSPFRTIGYTEKPDVVVGKLLEGRIALLVEGSPIAITLPYLFIENFQSSEDYYLSFFYTSFSRFLRIVGFLATVAVPGLYIAIVAFHHEMMPLPLFISIAAERASVPLPAAVEAFLMLFVFDILRETGVRMPSNIGQALSIVGALVIGQAAVEAKLIAAPMIIVVAFTGITNLLVPKMNASVIYIRLMLLLFASCFGFFGLVMGISIVLIHLLNLRTFGIPHIQIGGKLQYQEVKDTVIRAPMWQMLLRPHFAVNRVRMQNGGDSHD